MHGSRAQEGGAPGWVSCSTRRGSAEDLSRHLPSEAACARGCSSLAQSSNMKEEERNQTSDRRGDHAGSSTRHSEQFLWPVSHSELPAGLKEGTRCMVSYRSHINIPTAAERAHPLLSGSRFFAKHFIVSGRSRLCALVEQELASTSEQLPSKRCWNPLNKYRRTGLNKHGSSGTIHLASCQALIC